MNNTQDLPITDPHNPEPDLIPDAPAIDGAKNRDDWIEHCETVVEELCPVEALENLYAQRVALYLWRIDRVIGFEHNVSLGEIDTRSEKALKDSQEYRMNRVLPDRPTLQTIIKYEALLHLVWTARIPNCIGCKKNGGKDCAKRIHVVEAPTEPAFLNINK